MDRFITRQLFDRAHAPAVGAPADGLAQGMPYVAVIQSAITSGTVHVSIPSLHLSYTFIAHIQPGTPCSIGDTAFVMFDENKIPWVIAGLWQGVSLSSLEAEMATAEGKIATLEAHLSTVEAKLPANGKADGLSGSAWSENELKTITFTHTAPFTPSAVIAQVQPGGALVGNLVQMAITEITATTFKMQFQLVKATVAASASVRVAWQAFR